MRLIPQPHWAPVPVSDLPHREVFFPYTDSEFPTLQLVPIPSCAASLKKALLHLLDMLPSGINKGSFPSAFPPPGWSSPALAASPHTPCAPAPHQPGGPPLGLLQYLSVSLVLGSLIPLDNTQYYPWWSLVTISKHSSQETRLGLSNPRSNGPESKKISRHQIRSAVVVPPNLTGNSFW